MQRQKLVSGAFSSSTGFQPVGSPTCEPAWTECKCCPYSQGWGQYGGLLSTPTFKPHSFPMAFSPAMLALLWPSLVPFLCTALWAWKTADPPGQDYWCLNLPFLSPGRARLFLERVSCSSGNPSSPFLIHCWFRLLYLPNPQARAEDVSQGIHSLNQGSRVKIAGKMASVMTLISPHPTDTTR